MTAKFPVLCASVVVDSTSQTIVYHDGTADRTATITAGTYYVRGDGGADDLLAAVDTALEGAPSSALTSWTVGLALDVDNANKGATVTLTAGGAFTIKTSGTFDLALLGFSTQQSSTSSAVSSDVGAQAVWVGDQPYKSKEPLKLLPGSYQYESPDATTVYTFTAADKRTHRVLDLEHVSGKRVLRERNGGDETSTLEAWWDLASDGRAFELHLVPVSSGTTLQVLTTTSVDLECTAILHSETIESLPMRLSALAQERYAGSLRMIETSRPAYLNAVTASGAVTLGAFTSSGAGSVAGAKTASGAVTLGAFAASGAGTVVGGFAGGNVSYGDLVAMVRDMVSASNTASPGATAGGTLTINGVSLGSYDFHKVSGNQTISAFTSGDWFTTTADSVASFVVVDGDLTINSGQTVAAANRKLLTVWHVTGDLAVNGELNAAGGADHSSATGSNVTAGAILIDTGTYSSVTDPEVPAAGGAGAPTNTTKGTSGTAGTSGTGGGTGGGGSGGCNTSGTAEGGAGSAGTSFSSGGGGGGGANFPGGAAATAGGPGGTADAASGGFAGGGSGNPGGGDLNSYGGTITNGLDGTGGVLIVIVDGAISGTGYLRANGVNASTSNNGGGATGGGHVTVLCASGSGPTLEANGGDGDPGASTRPGGDGGTGTARLLTGLA